MNRCRVSLCSPGFPGIGLRARVALPWIPISVFQFEEHRQEPWGLGVPTCIGNVKVAVEIDVFNGGVILGMCWLTSSLLSTMAVRSWGCVCIEAVGVRSLAPSFPLVLHVPWSAPLPAVRSALTDSFPFTVCSLRSVPHFSRWFLVPP